MRDFAWAPFNSSVVAKLDRLVAEEFVAAIVALLQVRAAIGRTADGQESPVNFPGPHNVRLWLSGRWLALKTCRRSRIVT